MKWKMENKADLLNKKIVGMKKNEDALVLSLDNGRELSFEVKTKVAPHTGTTYLEVVVALNNQQLWNGFYE